MEQSVSQSTTRGVRVEVVSDYLPQQSDPNQGLWVFVYHVTITNTGSDTVQLRSRHWIITNSYGVEDHVRGLGVVGNQPVLDPGQSFSYTSGCPLDTPVGTMHGTYQMVLEGGGEFDAVVAPFTLARPYELN
jgi:ApaG protein